MRVIDGAFENYDGLHYFWFLLDGEELGLTTFAIEKHFKLQRRTLLKAVGQLQISPKVINRRSARKLRRAGLLPKRTTYPKFWTMDQVATIALQSGNKYAKSRLAWLETFSRALDDPTFEAVETPERIEQVISIRASQIEAEAKAAEPNSYLSREIVRLYPGVQTLVREYSNKNRERKKYMWCLFYKPMNALFTHWLGKTYGIKSRLTYETKSGGAKLFDKQVIDDLMANLGISKAEITLPPRTVPHADE